MFYKYNALTIIWAVIIASLMFLPGSKVPSSDLLSSFSFDKIVHFGIFAILSLLMVRGFKKQYAFGKLKQHALRYSLIISMIYGIVIEYTQSFVPERFVELEDLLANILGCAGGGGLFYLIYKF